MTAHAQYTPGPATGAQIRKEGELWTLILVRELRHSPEKVWQALTDPAHLREWSPYDADRNLATEGPAKLTLVGTPKAQVFDSIVKRAEPPRLLEYTWGGSDVRWQLEPVGTGTRLTLWHNIDRHYIAWGAAGWHIAFDVLDRLLSGNPIGRIAGAEQTKYGWQRLVVEYASQFGIEAPKWAPRTDQKP